MTTYKLEATIAALASFTKPASHTQITEVAGVSGATVYRHLQLLIATQQAHVVHYKHHPKGGPAEYFYSAGPAPEGYVPRLIPQSPEELAAKAAKRKALQRGYNREAKRKARAKKRAAYLAANPDVAKKLEDKAKLATLTEDDLGWIDPNFKYRPSRLAEPFAVLTQVWYSAIKGENHASTT